MSKNAKDLLLGKKSTKGNFGAAAAKTGKGGGLSGDNFKGKGSKGNCAYVPKNIMKQIKGK